MLAAVVVAIPLWSGSATTAATAGPGHSTCSVSSPHRNSRCKPTLPVADRPGLHAHAYHNSPRRRYEPVAQHQSKPGQQYYQPARQYYQWQEH
jgi:hypothetical protein